MLFLSLNYNVPLLQIVIDEADRTLDMGFAETIRSIVSNLPNERQTLLFSATQTRFVSKLKQKYELDD